MQWLGITHQATRDKGGGWGGSTFRDLRQS